MAVSLSFQKIARIFFDLCIMMAYSEGRTIFSLWSGLSPSQRRSNHSHFLVLSLQVMIMAQHYAARDLVLL
jgi:hypothetical protein